MSKKKKKRVKLTPRQKLQRQAEAWLHAAKNALRKAKHGISSGFAAADRFACAAYARTERFLRPGWSLLPLTLLMFGLMMLTYALIGKYYLTSMVYLFFPSTNTFYTPDYSLGFLAKMLAGEIWSLFSDTVSIRSLLKVCRTAEFISLILQSAVAAVLFRKAYLKKNTLLCAAAAVFVCSPITVMTFIYNMGMLDMYNVLLAALLFLISDTRVSLVLTPVLCALGVMNHYAFLLALFPAVFAVQLYYICCEKRLRGARIASLTLTTLVCVGLAAYFVFFATNDLRFSEQELNEYLLNKIPAKEQLFFLKDYYSDWLFHKHNGVELNNSVDTLRMMLQTSREYWTFHDLFPSFYTVVPFFGLLAYFWGHALRRAEKRKKLPYFCFLLIPLALPATLICSTDVTRFSAEFYLNGVILLAAVQKKDDAAVQEALDGIRHRINTPLRRAAVLLLVFAYAFVGLSFYTRWIPV